MTKTRFLALITALALLLTIPTAVFAQRVPPHVFVGSATLDNVTVVDGTAVTAWVEGVQAAATNASGGSYTLLIDQGDSSFSGKTVTFRVGSANADQTATWAQGGGDELNLTASSSNSTAPPVAGGSGAKGDTGAAGATGAAGSAGAAGPAGSAGPAGADGADGGGGVIGIIALIVAIVALLGAGGAYMMGRRV